MAATTVSRCSTPFLQAKQTSGSASLPGSLSLHKTDARRRSAASVQAKASSRRHLVAAAEVAAEASAEATSSAPGDNWVPLIPIETLPKGERRLVNLEGETVLLLWYKNEILALENSSPAEGAYAEGLYNAKLTQDGCIVCPLTDSTFDLKTGQIKDWYPNNAMMRLLTRPLRELRVYPVKIEDYQICVNLGGQGGSSAEIVFARTRKAGETADDLAVDEVRMIVDESEGGFGFTPKNELVNGRGAMIGFFLLIVIELVTGKGLLGSTGFLDFIYSASGSGPVLPQ